MIKKRHLLLAFLSLICFGISAQNIWNKRAAVGGSKRERGISFSISTKGYIGLGQDTLNLMLNDLWEYDPGTNSWTQKANFPGAARRDAASFVIATKAYVGTGIDNADAFWGTPLSDFWEYNPATNTWTSKTAFPGNSGFGTYYSTGFSLLGKGYFCCGKDGPSNYSNNLWQYDPATNSWLQKTDIPGAKRYGGIAFVIGNYAYFGTGTDENILTNDFYKYDPTTNLWTTLGNFPGSGRFSGSTFVISGKGYMVFGTDGGYKDELWQYDPALDYWFPKASFPGGARRSAGSFAIGGKGYAGAGKGLTGTRRDFWEYLPSIILGIEENASVIFSNVYPNPMTDFATIELSEKISIENLSWELRTIQGKLISSDKISHSTFVINRNNLSTGIYALNIYNKNGTIASKKIIVQ
jgi:N-acetylneuraminic acid mutarotase